MASVVHRVDDIAPPIQRFVPAMGMLVAPARSAACQNRVWDDVEPFKPATPAAVVVKVRRRLVLMVRETPRHLGHLGP